MNELRLLFDRSPENGYTVKIVPGSGSASEPIAFVPFLTDDDYDDLRWYLEEFMDLPDGGSVVRAQRVEANLAQWGRRLYDAIFKDGDHRELLNHLQREPAPRLLTLATRDATILHLPWELMADSRGPLTRQEITIRRQLETARAPIAFQASLPLRILYVVSRPGDLGFIDPRLSTRSMIDALAPLGEDVHVDFCRPPTLARLEEMLSAAKRDRRPYHLVHFDGHGTFLPEIELGALCFEKPDSAATLAQAKTDFVRADRLGELLAAYEIPLVILEACRTGTIGKVAVFRAVAPRLIESGVGSVLSMSHAVHVEAARVLLERFYRELVTGLTVGQALEQGRAALIANPHRWIETGPGGRTIELKDWHLPHLYQRGGDLVLVPARPAPPASSPTPPAKPFDVFLSHQHADKDRVERIALQLKARGLRVWFDKWEIGLGDLRAQCIDGVRQSRFVLLACTREALEAHWVLAEKKWACADDPRGDHVVPLLLENVELPPDLKSQLWLDFRDPAQDAQKTEELAGMIPRAAQSAGESTAAAVGRFRLASRDREQVGAFPPAPIYGFQGRAHELYELERQFRRHRAILLHAMGGMGKTTLAGEAALWWTRTGLFPDGACFVSFEQVASAERVIQVLGTYLEGNAFNSLSEADQRRRAGELFRTKRVLMVWDNFESVLPAFQTGAVLYDDEERQRLYDLFHDWTSGEKCEGRLLITCRPEDAGLPAARRTELRGLARPDSLWLLVRVLETAGVDLDKLGYGRDRLGRLLDALADHPLSIELVGPHLRQLTPEEILADFGRLLEQFRREGADVERNSSLLASLEFSKKRLSPAAQAALPWLGLFSGGVFEQILLLVSELDPQQWEAIRAELEATALIRVESNVLVGDRPYLRFHPTLAYAAAASDACSAFSRQRFVEAYISVMRAVDQALHRSNSCVGVEVLAREEANFRVAVSSALEDGNYAAASTLGGTFGHYLVTCGRIHERNQWVAWLATEVRRSGFTPDTIARDLDELLPLTRQGEGTVAIQRLHAIRERLSRTKEFNPLPLLAQTQVTLGQILLAQGLALEAVQQLIDAVKQAESLCVSSSVNEGRMEKGILAASLGTLGEAFWRVGRLDEALSTIRRAILISKALGNVKNVVVGAMHLAAILMEQGRYHDADNQYQEVLSCARQAGDKDMEADALQHQGALAANLNDLGRASKLLLCALKLYQEMDASDGVVGTLNFLGGVELQAGRLAEACSWLERSRELAEQLGDKQSMGAAIHNIGRVWKKEALSASMAHDNDRAVKCFIQAKLALQESLQLKRGLRNLPHEALACSELAEVNLKLDELDEAESHADTAREIFERLGLKEVKHTYSTLSGIARARGDVVQAVEWERKRDAMGEELAWRARGSGDSAGLPPQFLQAIQNLAMACAKAGFGEARPAELEPAMESALAQIDQLPAPLPELATFLRRLAVRELPAIPSGLPAELTDYLTQLLAAVRESGGHS